ncbi:MAG: hypothetical protein IJ151_00415 [Bacteroidales bacterium]|nr:hypothetical protein [Bacteroidales bacterium]
MESPFIYYRQVTGKNFLGHKEDCTILGNLLKQGEHAAVYAPPKSGKSSLIQQTLMKLRMSGAQFTVGEFNLINIRETDKFLLRYGNTVLRSVAVSPGEYSDLVAKYLEGTHFVFDARAYEESDAIISANWELDEADAAAILALPFKICIDKKINLIIIMDEFQNLLMCEGGYKICSALSQCLEQFKNNYDNAGRCCLVFCGSMQNTMDAIFRHTNLFYRHVSIVPVSQPDEKEIIEYIHRGFMLGGKEIDRSLLHGVCHLFRCNMWYINHFTSICDSLSRGYIVESVLMDALRIIISIHEPRFFALMEDLTTYQVSLLKAVIQGNTRFSSVDVIRSYGLNSSANVKRLKEALMKKEILYFIDKDTPVIADPLFEYWLKNYYYV